MTTRHDLTALEELGETPVEQRLRTVVDDARMDAVMIDDNEIAAIDAGREAIRLLRDAVANVDRGDADRTDALIAEARALLARCEGDR